MGFPCCQKNVNTQFPKMSLYTLTLQFPFTKFKRPECVQANNVPVHKAVKDMVGVEKHKPYTLL